MVHKPGDACRLDFEITVYEGVNKAACLYWDDIQLQCWSALPHKFSWPLDISQTGTLSLRYNEQIFAEKTIEIKSLLPNKRRRVRSPWSMF